MDVQTYMKEWLDKYELFIPDGSEGNGFLFSKIFGIQSNNNPSGLDDFIQKNNKSDLYKFVGFNKIVTGEEGIKVGQFINFNNILPLGGNLLLVTVLYEGKLYEMACSFVSVLEIYANKPYYYPCDKTNEELKSIFSSAIDNCMPHCPYFDPNRPIILSIERLRDKNYIPMYRKIKSYHSWGNSGYNGEYQKWIPEIRTSYYGVLCELSKKIQIIFKKELNSKERYDKEGLKYQDQSTYYYVGEIFFPSIYEMYDYIEKAKKSKICNIEMSDIVHEKNVVVEEISKRFISNEQNRNHYALGELCLSNDKMSAYITPNYKMGTSIGNSFSINSCIRVIHIYMTDYFKGIQNVFPDMKFYCDDYYYNCALC